MNAAKKPTAYLPTESLELAERIIHRFKREYPVSMHNEIRSAGLFGLTKAINRCDEARGLSNSFVGRCVRNSILDTLRHESYNNKYMRNYDASEDYDSANQGLDCAPAGRLVDMKRVMQLTQQLTTEREVVELALAGHTRVEIGRMLGLKKNTVTTRYHRAIRKMRTMLNIEVHEKAA